MTDKELRRKYIANQLIHENPLNTMVDVMMKFEKLEEQHRTLLDSLTVIELAVVVLAGLLLIMGKGNMYILLGVLVLSINLGYNIYNRNKQLEKLK